jgi:putative component of toxin-antitoxin plasmid stabilization module
MTHSPTIFSIKACVETIWNVSINQANGWRIFGGQKKRFFC